MARESPSKQAQAARLLEVACDLDATHQTLSRAQVLLVLEMIDAAGWEVVLASSWWSRRVWRRCRTWRRRWRGPVTVTIPVDQLVKVMNTARGETR